MGYLAQRLAAIDVRVTAPGTAISATLRGREDLRIRVGGDAYGRLSEYKLAEHLGALARLLFAAWQRAYMAVIDESSLDFTPVLPRDQEFRQARSEVRAEGSSLDQRITVSSTGMRLFSVRIVSGTIHALSEDEFNSSAGQAAAAMIRSFTDQTQVLMKKYYP